jgi:hypothetical protein
MQNFSLEWRRKCFIVASLPLYFFLSLASLAYLFGSVKV